ncbi:hypothetical protein TNCV_3225631 [Trichonephila clavipes]|nr:hypothetical protein TNCV_3225631 [Trichonephila clavipes]
MRIILKDEEPVCRQHPRRLAFTERQRSKQKQIEEWLNEGIIRPSSSRICKSNRNGSIPVPLKDPPCRAAMHVKSVELKRPPVGVVWELGECPLRCRHVPPDEWFKNYVVRRQKPSVAEQCDVNIRTHSLHF